MSDFEDHVGRIADKYLASLGHINACITSLNWDYSDSVGINYETSHCNCCSPDSDTEVMPIDLLWDNDLQSKIDKIVEKREADEKIRKEEQRETWERRQREADLKKLSELKAQYED